MIPVDRFFTHLNDFAHSEIFADVQHLWDPLKTLGESIQSILEKQAGNAERVDCPPWARLAGLEGAKGGKIVPSLYVEEWVQLESPVFIGTIGILIGKGTLLEPSAIIKGPAVIGSDCEIRQGAYIRDNAIVGNHCVIGHATEVKNSLFMDHTEAGHFNYIGDSIVGSHVNMGAGSRLANFQFRTPRDKAAGLIHEIVIPVGNESIHTGLKKLGAVVGDNVEIGCNTIISPGTLIGKNTWIYPNMTLPKGYYEPDNFIAPRERKPKITSK